MKRIVHIKRDFSMSAEHFGYLPWTAFAYWEMLALSKMVSPDTIIFIKDRLKDPSKASPEWLFHFLITIESIGIEQCRGKDDLYSFVTKHKLYEDFLVRRLEYRKEVCLLRASLMLTLPCLDRKDQEIIEICVKNMRESYKEKRDQNKKFEKQRKSEKNKCKNLWQEEQKSQIQNQHHQTNSDTSELANH